MELKDKGEGDTHEGKVINARLRIRIHVDPKLFTDQDPDLTQIRVMTLMSDLDPQVLLLIRPLTKNAGKNLQSLT